MHASFCSSHSHFLLSEDKIFPMTFHVRSKGQKEAATPWLTYPHSGVYEEMPRFTNPCKILILAQGFPSAISACFLQSVFQSGGWLNLTVNWAGPISLHYNEIQRTVSSCPTSFQDKKGLSLGLHQKALRARPQKSQMSLPQHSVGKIKASTHSGDGETNSISA